MIEVLARVASTGIIEQGGIRVMITREAIESIPDQVAGVEAIPLTVDHDPFCLPIGKVEDAWVEPFGKEFAVMARILVEETYTVVTHKRSGVDLVRLDFEDNLKPFIERRYKKTESQQDSVSVDLANFDGPTSYTAFADEVRTIDDTIVCDNGIQRHALIPDPLLQFVLSNPELSAALAIGVWALGRVEKFVRYTVDETLRKVADDISDSFSIKMKRISNAYATRRTQDSRATVAQIVIPGSPEVILLVKIEGDEEFPTINLKHLVSEMEGYGDILQEATSATFARTGIDKWELQYLTTHSGKVIGTSECYERTVAAFRRMGRSQSSESEDTTQDSTD